MAQDRITQIAWLGVVAGALVAITAPSIAAPPVNRTAAHGGSISGGMAPLAYHGDLIVGSGYGYASKMPGNVLLVYSVE